MTTQKDHTVVMIMGRTAAGKTQLSRYLAAQLGILHIPEAALKRVARQSYRTQDSLDEALRDMGYRAAMAVLESSLRSGISAIVDASFHRRRRREWLYKRVRQFNAILVIVYCRCDDQAEVMRRIALRCIGPKTAYTQADSIDIFRYIDNSFEELENDELQQTSTFIEIDSVANEIIRVSDLQTVPWIGESIKNYLAHMKDTDAERNNDDRSVGGA